MAALPAAVAHPQEAEPKRRPPVVHIGVDVVQVDAVVTDGKGQHVIDLVADDFEVLQDGKPRPILHCRYVAAEAPAAPPRAPDETPPPPLTALRPQDVRRVMALVVDERNLSPEGLMHTQQGLRRFIESELRPGDLVALAFTREKGDGILQQFTGDRRLLAAAVEEAGRRVSGRGFGLDPVGMPGMEPSMLGGLERAHLESRETGGTFEAVAAILQAMRSLPGRKSLVLFSERLKIRTEELELSDDAPPQIEADSDLAAIAREVTDLANRASVVVYTVDPRGPMAQDPRAAQTRQGRTAHLETQNGHEFLAGQTGGLFLSLKNDMEATIRQVQEDQKGYYLIGFAPDEESFDRASKDKRPVQHRLKVRVKKPGLHVRSRAGFLGVADEPESASHLPSDRTQALVQAMLSPFPPRGVPIRLTPVLGNDPQKGLVLRAFVHVDAAAVEFEATERGHEARLQVAAALVGRAGKPQEPVEREMAVGVGADKLAGVKAAGIVLDLTVPVVSPGTYQLRASVRDAASRRVGAAMQVVDVPDLSKRRLAATSLVLGAEADRMASAVRRFAAGTEVTYAFVVYHAGVDEATGKPAFTTRLRLARGGVLLRRDMNAAQGLKPLPAGEKGVAGFMVAGKFTLPAGLEPGEYGLQFVVVDPLAKADGQTSEQWTSLEVVTR